MEYGEGDTNQVQKIELLWPARMDQHGLLTPLPRPRFHRCLQEHTDSVVVCRSFVLCSSRDFKCLGPLGWISISPIRLAPLDVMLAPDKGEMSPPSVMNQRSEATVEHERSEVLWGVGMDQTVADDTHSNIAKVVHCERVTESHRASFDFLLPMLSVFSSLRPPSGWINTSPMASRILLLSSSPATWSFHSSMEIVVKTNLTSSQRSDAFWTIWVDERVVNQLEFSDIKTTLCRSSQNENSAYGSGLIT